MLCAVTLLTALLMTAGEDDDNLLNNPGFEKGGKSFANWQTIYPPSLANPRPTFQPTEEQPPEGRRAASVVVQYEGGYTSFAQTLPVPRKAKSVHLECMARIDDPDQGGAASMMVWFTVPGSAQGGSSAMSQRLTTETDWTLLTVDAAVPEGATEMIVRCGVFGPCSASFDSAVATCSTEDVVPGKLAVAHGDYRAKASGAQKKPWIRLSIPFPIGGQTPLAVRVTSDPPDQVAGLVIEKERENRPLEVRLKPMKAGDEVQLRVETLALLRDRPISEGKGVPLKGRKRPPREISQHLKAAPGVDADHKDVKKIARTLPDDDLYGLMEGLREFLKENMEYAGGGDQGSRHCLESGQAVCTGYANTTSALLIARGVPTRILACTGLGARLQEHYIVEAWTSELGWSRMESTAAMFPWRDSENLVLRIVYPDDARSVVNVPLYRDSGNNVVCTFRMGEDTCWQGGEQLRTFALSSEDLAELEEVARDAFEKWTRKASEGPTHVLVPEQHDLGQDCAALVEAAHTWAGEAGRLDG